MASAILIGVTRKEVQKIEWTIKNIRTCVHNRDYVRSLKYVHTYDGRILLLNYYIIRVLYVSGLIFYYLSEVRRSPTGDILENYSFPRGKV